MDTEDDTDFDLFDELQPLGVPLFTCDEKDTKRVFIYEIWRDVWHKIRRFVMAAIEPIETQHPIC